VKERRAKPPWLAKWILKQSAGRVEKLSLADDLEEEYNNIYHERGRLHSLLWYWIQVARALPQLLVYGLKWRMIMFKNYLKIAFRNIQKHKGYSFINIAGLSVGITVCILIFLWVQDELSYDRFHEHAGDLYVATYRGGSKVTPYGLGVGLKDEYPEIIRYSRLEHSAGRELFAHEDKSFMENSGFWVDPSFILMFSIQFIHGDPIRALNDPRSIVISKTMAEKYFGNENALGKTITTNNRYDFTVTGVMHDFPHNSYLQFDFLRSLSAFAEFGIDLNRWQPNDTQTWVQLQNGVSSRSVDEKISDIVHRHRPSEERPLFLQPITRLRVNPVYGHGTQVFVIIFSVMALFILLIACMNFMNLSTARSVIRAREVGMRKVVGAHITDLMKQFFGESFLLTVISFLLGFGLVWLLLPFFSNLSGKVFTLQSCHRISTILGFLGIVLLTGMIAGSYPALYLSSFTPVKILRGVVASGKKGTVFRKVLVVIQFTLSIFLIIGTMAIYRQIDLMRTKDLGYDKASMIYTTVRQDLRERLESIKSEVLQHPNILNVTVTNNPLLYPEANGGVNDVHWEGKQDNQRVPMWIMSVDHDFLETFKIDLVEGRFFSRELSTDADEGFVVNEAAIRAMEMESPIGNNLQVMNFTGKIIGIVRDFHFESLHSRIKPMAMKMLGGWWQDTMCIRLRSQDVQATLEFLREKWKVYTPAFPFEYRFLDESLEGLYREEQQVGEIGRYATILAICISCLGLFGLASFMAEQRTKEIGIRKVLGSSVWKITSMLTIEFIKWVLIANIFAWPLAYIALGKLLSNFEYRISVGLDIFLLSAASVLLVAVLTVVYQSVRAALANPVEALKYE